MSEVRIAKDGSVNTPKQYLMGLMPIVAVLAFNWALGFSTTTLLIGGVGGVIIWIIVAKSRGSWGQSITFSDNAMSVEKVEGRDLIINASSVTAATIKSATIVITWRDNEKQRTLVIGSESFKKSTWSRLVMLFGEFAPDEVLERT